MVYIHNSDTYIHDLHFCICIVQLMTTTKLVNQSHYLCSPHQQLYSDFVELVDRLAANETDAIKSGLEYEPPILLTDKQHEEGRTVRQCRHH